MTGERCDCRRPTLSGDRIWASVWEAAASAARAWPMLPLRACVPHGVPWCSVVGSFVRPGGFGTSSDAVQDCPYHIIACGLSTIVPTLAYLPCKWLLFLLLLTFFSSS